ncbi:MAG: NAD(P)-dependent alcohol dehydrogenase [Bacteroidales bacterium]|nr:NAD(P)-dependent alcohol dehydrogenase [Bacteroidales bacterium]MCF8455586.1 NAD(P)-dependent alcohol dehydrogenase [Bacteroidales bacterium]
MKTKMNAIVATGYGNPDVLKLAQVDKPSPKENEVLVKVVASAATRADSMIRTGKPYFGRLFIGLTKPKNPIPGTGFAGIIELVGSEVSKFNIGDRVFGETLFSFSANAEYLVVAENGVVLNMPEGLNFNEAANFCDGHLTSYNFLNELIKVEPGQHVLINGASGSLGTSAVQIAKYFGAKVTAVCSTRNVGMVESLGADKVIDYQKKDFTKSSAVYDVIYDTIGTSSFAKCKPALKENGVYLSPVLKLPLIFQMIATAIRGKKKAKFEATGSNSPEKLSSLLSEVLEVYKAGKLKTVIDRQYPLEKLEEAHRYIASGHKKGNVVIMVQS